MLSASSSSSSPLLRYSLELDGLEGEDKEQEEKADDERCSRSSSTPTHVNRSEPRVSFAMSLVERFISALLFERSERTLLRT